MTAQAGWTAAQIKAAMVERGISLRRLSRDHGFGPDYFRTALKVRFPKAQRILSDVLEVPLHEIWPAWFDEAGNDPRSPKHTSAAFERVLARVEQGERLRDVCAEPGQPCESTVLLYRRDDPAYALRFQEALDGRPGAPVAAGRVSRMLAALETGESIRTQTIIPAPTVSRLQRNDRSLAARVTKLTAGQQRHGASPLHREAFVRALRSDQVYALAERAVPRQLPPDCRDDVKSDLVVAILSGEVRPEDASAAAVRLARRWDRMFLRRDLSLDDDYGREGESLADQIADLSSITEGDAYRVLVPEW